MSASSFLPVTLFQLPTLNTVGTQNYFAVAFNQFDLSPGLIKVKLLANGSW